MGLSFLIINTELIIHTFHASKSYFEDPVFNKMMKHTVRSFYSMQKLWIVVIEELPVCIISALPRAYIGQDAVRKKIKAGGLFALCG